MKTKFSKVLVLLAMLAVVVSASAVFAATDGSGVSAGGSAAVPSDSVDAEHTYLAVADGSVTLDTENDAKATVSIVAKDALKYYNIEGNWSIKEEADTAYLSLSAIALPGATIGEHDSANAATGKVLWVDDSMVGVAFAQGEALMTATYNVAANTPDGTYKVKFTLNVLSVGTDDPVEETYVFEATITVSHTCNGANETPEVPATCISYGTKAYYQCSHCEKYYSDADCKNEITTKIEIWKNNDGRIAMKSHSFGDWNDEIPATCTETGTLGHKVCESCKLSYDANNKLIKAEDLVIPVDNDAHKWSDTPSSYTINEANGTHTANYVCIHNKEHTKSDKAVEHDFTNGDCVCGAVKPVTNIAVTYKGAALANAYTVEGQVVTVTYASACKVGYLDTTTNKYVAITAVANADGSYSFTAPEGVTEVLLVVKGDVNGNGSVNVLDKGILGKSILPKNNPNYAALSEAWQIFAADLNNNGSVNVLDKGILGKSILPKNNVNYQPLEW